MRIAVAFVLAACTPSTKRPPLEARAPTHDEPCDVGAWKALATSPRRARISGREVIVVAERGDRTQVVAWLGRSILVGTDVSGERLDRVVTHENAVARAPGGPWLPGVVAEPGLAASGSGAWLAVHSDSPLEVIGFVPRAATGRLWEAHDAPVTGSSLPAHAELLAAPAFGAEQVASITGGYDIVDRVEPGPAGWQRVEAHTGAVRVEGWTEVPRPSPLHNIYDFSDDTIEGDLVYPDGMPARPHAEPGCIRARPDDGAPVLGIVTDAVWGRSFSAGWLEGSVDAPWGRIDGYVRGAVSTDPPWL